MENLGAMAYSRYTGFREITDRDVLELHCINFYTVIQGWNKAVLGVLINYEHTIMRFGVVTLAVWCAVRNPGPSYLIDISLHNLIWLYPII